SKVHLDILFILFVSFIKSCFDKALFLYKKQICINFYKKILNLLNFVYIIIKNEKIMKNSEEKE
ncbi:hypothetical protein, partial [Clostridium perfringens]|uniref:hypothetical protein n=1 Tax=Clostridium perfringens TaxID=1502 RepID=UPI0032DA89DA